MAASTRLGSTTVTEALDQQGAIELGEGAHDLPDSGPHRVVWFVTADLAQVTGGH